MDITFSSLVTPAGVVVAGGLITTLVQLLKNVIPKLDAKVSGALQAFLLSAGLYGVAGWAIGIPTPDAGLGVFAAWLACATAAVGIKATADHVGEVRA